MPSDFPQAVHGALLWDTLINVAARFRLLLEHPDPDGYLLDLPLDDSHLELTDLVIVRLRAMS